ncbi:MAG: 2-hydroxyglutaryl-CoA dehydratase [Ruminococcaceae bacterium]|nr:2-hydroxyglutaryl-CoA dehydratase [Oscillospiraceae bacterium]
MSRKITDRIEFTKEMKKDYTILFPNMLPIHFELIRRSFAFEGYKIEMMTDTDREIVNEGLRDVHNDTCYPALLVIGQLIHALKSGRYDVHKTALLITQTGGGCRASNYIHLLRKALVKVGLEFVPVISLNVSGLEKNSGFRLSIPLVRKMLNSVMYGDMIVHLANQVRPYELVSGETDRTVAKWLDRLSGEFDRGGKYLRYRHVLDNCEEIVSDFEAIPILPQPRVRVGVVGEIYIKFAPLGNNNLEEFLASEGAEVIVPGLMDFCTFKVDNRLEDIKLYGGKKIKYIAVSFLKKIIIKAQDDMIDILARHPRFRKIARFEENKALVADYMGYGNKMGEGWLLTAEMLELIHSGTTNIVCAQPFGCLPNHIAGKGMIRRIKDNHPEANIVAIDYDPGATRINQENRIKLMLSTAKRRLDQQSSPDIPEKTDRKEPVTL